MTRLDTLAARLRHARTLRKMTQAKLAEAVGISQPMIRKIESGSETSKVVELAAALDVRPQWLATGAEPMASGLFVDNEGSIELQEAIDELIAAVKHLPPTRIRQIAQTIDLFSASGSEKVISRTVHPDGTKTDHSTDTALNPRKAG